MADTRSCEVRLTAVGKNTLIIRGRLAWLMLKLAERGGAQLAEDVDRLGRGQLLAKWGDNGQVEVQTQRTYNWPGEQA